MKKAAIIALGAISFLPVATFGQAVQETPATLFLVQGGNPQGFIQGSNATGILFSRTQGQRGEAINYSQIKGEGLNKGIRISARAEALAEARSLFAEGNYRDASVAYGKVADEYAIIVAIPQNFATEARYFQIESLRRAGAFSAIPALLETPAAKNITTHLPEGYQRGHKFQKLWALYGAKKMDELKSALDLYQVPVTGQAKLLSTPNFVDDVNTDEMAQLSFLRAKVFDSEGDREKALQDYYRVITLTYSNDPFLAKQSMGAAMVIQKENPSLNDEKNKVALRQMQSLAFLFSKYYGATSMPEAFKEYAVRPELPKREAAPEEEGEAAEAGAPEEGAAAEGEGEGKEGEKKAEEGAAPAEGEKKAEEGEKKAKE